jgi:cephalosporin hydroxylase
MKDDFEAQKAENIRKLGERDDVAELTNRWVTEVSRNRYSYHFTWMGRPIIQFPQDMIAMQEIIWDVQPDLIIETGVARGGSLVYYASLLELIGGDGMVLGIDVDIRPHNREAIESHRMAKRIRLIEGSSVAPEVVEEARGLAEKASSVVVVLDSNHTHEHVLQELQLYSPFVTRDSYVVAFDTIIEDLPEDFYPDRPWGKGDNAKTAVLEFLRGTDAFEVDRSIENKLQITVAPNGYLRRVRD